jgi:kynurenine formamidase
VGFASGDIPAFAANIALLKEASVLGVWWGTWAEKNPDLQAHNMRELAKLLSAGQLSPVTSESYTLDDFRKAFAAILLRTGFARHWPDAARYLGTAERGEAAVAHLHFPGLHPDAARWLVANRAIGAIGIDTASIDYGQSTQYESHRVLYERNVPAFENLAALDRLPPVGATVVALPMKIKGGSGAPLRAIALLPR